MKSKPTKAPILAELRTSEVTLSDQFIISGLNFLIKKMRGLKKISRVPPSFTEPVILGPKAIS